MQVLSNTATWLPSGFCLPNPFSTFTWIRELLLKKPVCKLQLGSTMFLVDIHLLSYLIFQITRFEPATTFNSKLWLLYPSPTGTLHDDILMNLSNPGKSSEYCGAASLRRPPPSPRRIHRRYYRTRRSTCRSCSALSRLHRAGWWAP